MDTKDDGLTTLATANNEFEALLLVNALDDRGVTARATGTFTSQFRAEAPGLVRILVKSADLAVARSVVEEVRNQPPPPAEKAAAPAHRSGRNRFVVWTILISDLLAIACVAVRLLTVEVLSFAVVIVLLVAAVIAALAVAALRRP